MKQGMEERVASSIPSPYMGLPEAAGYCCSSYSTFRQWTYKRLLPSYKIGKRVLYKQVDLDAFIEKHLRRSHEQLNKALDQRKQELQTTTIQSTMAAQKGGRS
jgi:excisionase family DNA binding protein